MDQKNRVIRLLRIALIIFIWYGLGLIALSFTIDKILEGIIELVIVGIAIFILIDGRLFLILKDREISGKFLIPMYLLIAVIIYDIIRSFQINDLYVLDQLHYFALIEYINSAGLIILLLIMLWETITLTRLYFMSGE